MHAHIIEVMKAIGTDVFDPRATRNERKVRRRFWIKVRRTLGRVPFMDDAVAAYFCAMDKGTPVRVKAVLLAALAYFIMPVDMIPDFILGLGYTDDAAVMFAAIRSVRRHITDDHRERAAKALEKERN